MNCCYNDLLFNLFIYIISPKRYLANIWVQINLNILKKLISFILHNFRDKLLFKTKNTTKTFKYSIKLLILSIRHQIQKKLGLQTTLKVRNHLFTIKTDLFNLLIVFFSLSLSFSALFNKNKHKNFLNNNQL